MKNPIFEGQWRVGEPTEIDEPVLRIAYSTGEFADMMGVPISRVRHWIAAGYIKANRLGRLWMIPQSEVRRLGGFTSAGDGRNEM
jgi:excisionase family DNA binding protein